MRDLINDSDEPLDPFFDEPTINDLINKTAAKIVARKKPCPEDPREYPLTYQYRRNLNQLKSEGFYDQALEVAVLINSTDELLEL